MKIAALFINLCLLFSDLKAQEKPNVIFILADDLGIGDLGVYGQKLIETPNIDLLAKSGILFNQFYSGTAVCAPSRSALLTGLHTGHTQIRANKSGGPEGQWPLPQSAFTIAELFKKSGYTTGNFGKWGLGFVGTEGDPNHQGFDEFYGYNCQTLAHNYFPKHLWHNQNQVKLNHSGKNHQTYSANLIHKQALNFIERNSTKPFFAFLSYTLPHAALQIPENDPGFLKYRKKFNEQPDTNKYGKFAIQKYPRAAYAAMVSLLDKQVGEVLAKLKSLNIDKNTLVVFTSDNGAHEAGGNDPHFFNSNSGFKGVKRHLYEGGIRTPMIISWPQAIKPGSISEHVAAFWDFMPTFAELVEQPIPQSDGVSILPALKNQPNQKQHLYLYWELHEQGGKQALRWGNWKAVRLNAMNKPDTAIELYDLKQDPSETKNVASQYPEVVTKIVQFIAEAHQPNKDFPFLPGE
ncbi:MAG: arylsulfatase [Bacteroidetes bacterium]|nr:arylsulfatase [Bacteroidota bacterium]